MENQEKDSQHKQTTQILTEFHRQAKEIKPAKEPTHSEDVLQFCAFIIMILSIISCPVICLAYDFNFFIALGLAFVGFTSGVLLYVVAKICRLLDTNKK